jgi:hypothetical protein
MAMLADGKMQGLRLEREEKAKFLTFFICIAIRELLKMIRLQTR